MFKNYYNKIIKKMFSSKGRDPSRTEGAPYRDWKIVAISFFALFLVSLGFNIYMSFQINNDSFFATTPKTYDGVVFNREGLQKVLSVLAQKEAFLLAPTQANKPVVDPSR
jgi:hypothetical protein